MPTPNIIYIMADDMGFGDPAPYSVAEGPHKIPTPNMDRLAREGMRFTDAHSASAVCTPSRYAALTGRYCWRTRLRSGVMWGYSPPLIDDDRPTVASMLGDAGYATAAVGKWHLGLGSGGFSDPRSVDPEPGGPEGQLYNMVDDPHETTNLWQEEPAVVERLSKLMYTWRQEGRSVL